MYDSNVDKIYTLTQAVESLGKVLTTAGPGAGARVDIEDTITKLLALIDALGEKELEELDEETRIG